MTQYAGIYLMFPLMFHYYHISLDAHCASPNGPNGPCANLDGLLEPRLLVSRNGVNFSYADGPNGRDASCSVESGYGGQTSPGSSVGTSMPE